MNLYTLLVCSNKYLEHLDWKNIINDVVRHFCRVDGQPKKWQNTKFNKKENLKCLVQLGWNCRKEKSWEVHGDQGKIPGDHPS